MWQFIIKLFVGEFKSYIIWGVLGSLALTIGYYVVSSHFEHKFALKQALNYQAKAKFINTINNEIVKEYQLNHKLINNKGVKCNDTVCKENIPDNVKDQLRNLGV